MSDQAKQDAVAAFSELYDTVKALKDPGGCEWDIRQTYRSLRPYFLEEVYEVLEAIDAGDTLSLQEELGDIMLHLLFQYDIASRSGDFSAAESMRATSDKLVKRHPHIFGDSSGDTSLSGEEIEARYEQIKRKETGRMSVIKDLPRDLPSTSKAEYVQRKAKQAGVPLAAAAKNLFADRQKGESEADHELRLGELLMTLIHHISQNGIDPESALRRAVNRFTDRVRECEAEAGGVPLDELAESAVKSMWQSRFR